MLFGLIGGRSIRNRCTGSCFDLDDLVHAARLAKVNYVTGRIGTYEDEKFVSADMMKRNIVTGELIVSSTSHSYTPYKKHRDNRILSMALDPNALDELYRGAGTAIMAAEEELKQKGLDVRYELDTIKLMKRLRIRPGS